MQSRHRRKVLHMQLQASLWMRAIHLWNELSLSYVRPGDLEQTPRSVVLEVHLTSKLPATRIRSLSAEQMALVLNSKLRWIAESTTTLVGTDSVFVI